MVTDIRRCGKCGHFQDHKVTLEKIKEKKLPENGFSKRTLQCSICGEELIEPIEDGFGNPFKEGYGEIEEKTKPENQEGGGIVG